MGNKLLIRSYNVGLGDCFYVRIPNPPDDFHILIDCGTKGSATVLKNALEHLQADLPFSTNGKKRLDLIVATHRHEDHIKGFDPLFFKNIDIKNIWITAMMNPTHPQAGKARSLDETATRLVAELDASALALNPDLALLASLFSISNDGAETALRKTLPEANNITPKYVVAGNTATSLGIQIKDTEIFVLGPENDIDRFYLGQSADPNLLGLSTFKQTIGQHAQPTTKEATPSNISKADFRRLQSRMMHDAFAFAKEASEVINNSSVVLLIKWKTKRLLFVGDAEWHDHYEEGSKNGAWNVMWNQRKLHLNAPLDFLKIGHHGSFNATPFSPNQPSAEVNAILNAILPRPKAGKKPKAKAIVSTERTIYPSIPQPALMTELGMRLSNSKVYKKAFTDSGKTTETLPNFDLENDFFGQKQPVRTDFESVINDKLFVEVEL